jgi:hypothetical protein
LGRAHTSLGDFAVHTFAASVPLVFAWVLLGLAHSGWFQPAKGELPVLLGLVGLFFIGVRIPATPRSALILPPLLAVCAYGLLRNRIREQRTDLLEAVLGHIRPASCLLLFLMPLAAVVVYAPVAVWGWTLPTNWLLYLVTMPLGFFFLARSLWVLHRPAR